MALYRIDLELRGISHTSRSKTDRSHFYLWQINIYWRSSGGIIYAVRELYTLYLRDTRATRATAKDARNRARWRNYSPPELSFTGRKRSSWLLTIASLMLHTEDHRNSCHRTTFRHISVRAHASCDESALFRAVPMALWDWLLPRARDAALQLPEGCGEGCSS